MASAVALHAAETPPLEIAKQGYIYAGGKYVDGRDGKTMAGQAYVEYQIPQKKTHPYPIVMIHGGGQNGSNFTGTPGRPRRLGAIFPAPGLRGVRRRSGGPRPLAAASLLRRNRAAERRNSIEERFTAPERSKLWPQATTHTQWPGTGVAGDPSFDQFYAEQMPSLASFPKQQELNRDAGIALLDMIGPAIVMVHSQSGTFGWPIADARPNLVKAIVAVEPSGPPVRDAEFKGAPNYFVDGPLTKPWGLGAMTLTYDGVTEASQLSFVQQEKSDAPDLVKCWRQREPAKQLTNLKSIPVLIVTSEASYHAPYDHCTSQYLTQAGVKHTFIRLADRGIKGNGHMMMLEKNNQEIAALMADWLKDVK